jgi:hypothetical protein
MAITSGKSNGSKPNSNFVCNLVWQAKYQIFNEHLKKERKKVWKTANS